MAPFIPWVKMLPSKEDETFIKNIYHFGTYHELHLFLQRGGKVCKEKAKKGLYFPRDFPLTASEKGSYSQNVFYLVFGQPECGH